MISEAFLLKFSAVVGVALSGLTVLVRLGRLLEQVEALRIEVAALRSDTQVQGRMIARIQGQVD